MAESTIGISIAAIIVTAMVIILILGSILILLSIFFCCCGIFMMLPSSKLSDPMPIIKRLLPLNYIIESHTCTTPDGYILTMTRVFNPDIITKNVKNPILL